MLYESLFWSNEIQIPKTNIFVDSEFSNKDLQMGQGNSVSSLLFIDFMVEIIRSTHK